MKFRWGLVWTSTLTLAITIIPCVPGMNAHWQWGLTEDSLDLLRSAVLAAPSQTGMFKLLVGEALGSSRGVSDTQPPSRRARTRLRRMRSFSASGSRKRDSRTR
ncbi:MAG: hypothetical protein RL701_687 [Pseudomonadota bacterium]